MKKWFLLKSLAIVFCLATTSFAEETNPQSVTSVTTREMDELENMHAKGERLIAADQLREALDVYWEIILLEPDDEVAYTNLGHIYLILGDHDRAKDAFQNALHINPNNKIARDGLKNIANPDENPPSEDEDR